MVVLSRFTWIDLPLMLIPGVLLFLLALSWQGYEAERVMAIWSLVTYAIFLVFYVAARLLLPRSTRVLVSVMVVVPAVLSFLAGGPPASPWARPLTGGLQPSS